MRVRPRRLAALLAAVVLALLVLDAARPPERQLTAAAVVAAIHLYQRVGSPLAHGAGVRCRFEPTCSHYAEASFRRHGLVRGGWRTVRRIARCGPWTPMGTVDEP